MQGSRLGWGTESEANTVLGSGVPARAARETRRAERCRASLRDREPGSRKFRAAARNYLRPSLSPKHREITTFNSIAHDDERISRPSSHSFLRTPLPQADYRGAACASAGAEWLHEVVFPALRTSPRLQDDRSLVAYLYVPISIPCVPL